MNTTLPIRTRKESELIPESDVLYKAYLIPSEMDLLRLGIDEQLAKKIIYRVIDGGETSVIATKPLCWDLVDFCDKNSLELVPLIRSKVDTYRFLLLSFCCSFRSHSGSPHPFVWGEMSATFSSIAGSGDAIAYDLWPSELTDPILHKKEFGLPNVKIGISDSLTLHQITDFADSMVTRNELDEADKSIEVSCNKS